MSFGRAMNEQAGQSVTNAKPRHWRRWVLGVLILLVLLTALAPTLLSTGPGKGLVLSRLRASTTGHLSVDSLQLGWFGPLSAEGIALDDRHGRRVVSVAAAECQAGLLSLLTGRQVGQIHIRRPEVVLVADENGRFSVADIFPRRQRTTRTADWTDGLRRMAAANVKLIVEDGSVRIIDATGSASEIRNVGLSASVGGASAHAATGSGGTLNAELSLTVDQIKSYGVAVGQFDLSLRLAEGKIAIPVTVIDVNDGKLRLDGQVRLAEGPGGGPPRASYRLKHKLRLIDRVRIDKNLSTAIISRINPPAFYEPEEITGRVSLLLEDVYVPFDATAWGQSRVARGRLEFEDLHIKPRRNAVLGEILSLLGLATGGIGRADISGVDFMLADGRISYDNFQIVWNGLYHLKFSGSVGLDESVDLTVGLPITPDLLVKLLDLPKLGAAEQLARLLGGTYVPLRISGTRRSPKLHLGGLRQVLQGIIGDLVRVPGQLGGGLTGLLKEMAEAAGEIVPRVVRPRRPAKGKAER